MSQLVIQLGIGLELLGQMTPKLLKKTAEFSQEILIKIQKAVKFYKKR